MYLLSAFGGGLWIIPVLTFLAGSWSLYRGYVASKSNSTRQLPGHQGTLDNQGNVPIYKTSGFKFAMGFYVATIIIIIYMVSER